MLDDPGSGQEAAGELLNRLRRAAQVAGGLIFLSSRKTEPMSTKEAMNMTPKAKTGLMGVNVLGLDEVGACVVGAGDITTTPPGALRVTLVLLTPYSYRAVMLKTLTNQESSINSLGPLMLLMVPPEPKVLRFM